MSFISRSYRFAALFTIVCVYLMILGSGVSEASTPELLKIQTQTPLSLEQLLDAARTHNPDLQKAKLDLTVNRMLKLGAIGDFLPSLGVGYQISQSSYYSPTYTNPDGTVSFFDYSPWNAGEIPFAAADSGIAFDISDLWSHVEENGNTTFFMEVGYSNNPKEFNNRRKITFNTTGIGENLENFPVMVELTDTFSLVTGEWANGYGDEITAKNKIIF